MSNPSPKPPSDEIDFEPFFKSIINAFRFVFRQIAQLAVFIKNKFWRLIIMAFVGAALSVALTFVIQPSYYFSMIVSSHFYSNQYFTLIANNVNGLIKDENFAGIAAALEISENEAMHLQEIYIHEVPAYLLVGDTARTNLFYSINVGLSDTKASQSIQTGLFNYINKNNYAESIKEQRKESLERLANKMQTDIQQIDSLKELVARSINPSSSNSGFIFGEPVDPASLFTQENQLFKEQLKYEYELSFNDNMILVSGFQDKLHADFPKKRTFALYGFGIGFLLSLIFLGIRKSS